MKPYLVMYGLLSLALFVASFSADLKGTVEEFRGLSAWYVVLLVAVVLVLLPVYSIYQLARCTLEHIEDLRL